MNLTSVCRDGGGGRGRAGEKGLFIYLISVPKGEWRGSIPGTLDSRMRDGLGNLRNL